MDFGQLVVSGSDKNAAIRDDLVVKNKIAVVMFQRKRMIPLPVQRIAGTCIAAAADIGRHGRQIQSMISSHELEQAYSNGRQFRAQKKLVPNAGRACWCQAPRRRENALRLGARASRPLFLLGCGRDARILGRVSTFRVGTAGCAGVTSPFC